jgi:GTP-binding protein HflX
LSEDTVEDAIATGIGAVFHPTSKSRRGQSVARRDSDSALAEIVGLAEAIGLDVRIAECVPIAAKRPSTLFGKGKVQDLEGAIAAADVGLVIVDTALTPVQQRNLETEWKVKVIDRTGLILEIFGARAQTREGRLQVELASLSYQRSRLVRSWTHLERQRGGFGFLGGPGERQIESDRRMIDQRITRLKLELTTVKRTRKLHRESRSRVPYPIVALVGYTNAGKSTLFNRLSNADVMVDDMLFATLDPTMRALKLARGPQVILSDTVGFISNLPTDLVAAFSATLEEVLSADIIIHVRDVSHADTEAQREDVIEVLKKLGLDETDQRPTIEVLNKIDLLSPEDREAAITRANRNDSLVALSAVTGQGAETLLEAISDTLMKEREVLEVTVRHDDGATLAWLHAHGDVLEHHSEDGQSRLKVSLTPADAGRYRHRHGATLPLAAD